MVSHPGEYPWSSYQCNAWGHDDELIHSHPVYESIDRDIETRLHAYRELYKVHIDSDQIHEMREALNRELVLGRDDFKEKIEAMTKRQTRPATIGRPRVNENSPIYYVI